MQTEQNRIRTSVIIPVYNTAEYLAECVDSVLAQTQKEIEIILVDDGSDDGSWEMAQEYAARYPFIQAVRQEHLYQGTARNRGLDMARGEYVYFMDSDDAILPELFERCYRICEEETLDFAMFDARGFRYDENDRELEVPDDIVDRRQMGIEDRLYTGPEFWNTFYNCHGVLYVCWLLYIRRDYLLKHDLRYEERTYFEDNDWMLRMYLHAEQIRYIPEIFHRHRWRRGSNMLDGFTVGLLEGCFRMHRVLLRLYTLYQHDTERCRMVEDVLYLNLRRFDRLQEIRPVPAYTDPLEQFCVWLRGELDKGPSEEGESVYQVHLAAAVHILRAAETWEDRSFYEKYRGMVSGQTILHLPQQDAHTRIAVFGAGKIGQYYAGLLKMCAAKENIVIVDSGKERGMFCGFPLYNTRELPELKPDIVVIASTKYREEMQEEARKLCGEQTEIRCVPREIRFLV